MKTAKDTTSEFNTYRPNEDRKKVLLIFIWLVFAFEMLYLSLNLLEYHILRQIAAGVDVAMKEISQNDIRRVIINFFSSLTYLLSLIYFIRWFRRSYFNLQFFTKSKTRYRNSSAVLSWFIPIVNFYKPFLIMREIWIKSQDLLIKTTKWNQKSKGYIVTIWWILWLFSTFFGKFIIHFILDPWNINELMGKTLMHIIASLLWIPLTLVTARMINNYTRMEKILSFRFVDNTSKN